MHHFIGYVPNAESGKPLKDVVARFYHGIVEQPVYSDESGTPLGQAVSDEKGRIDCWIQDGTCDITYSYNGEPIDTQLKYQALSPETVGADISGAIVNSTRSFATAAAGLILPVGAEYEAAGRRYERVAESPGYQDIGPGSATVSDIDLLKGQRVSLLEYPVNGDGLFDNRALIEQAIAETTAAGKVLFIPKPEVAWAAADSIRIMSSGARIVFEEGAWIRCTVTAAGGTSIGGVFLINGNPTRVSDIIIVRPHIDANFKPGENCISGTGCSDVFVYDARVKNARRHPARLGGKGLQFENNTVSNCHFIGYDVQDCSIGLEAQGFAAAPTTQVTYRNGTMGNVGIPIHVGDTSSSSTISPGPDKLDATVDGLTLRNCGRVLWDGSTDPLGGAIVCGERGHGLKVRNISVVNDPSYGQIGALVRGTMVAVDVDNFMAECDVHAIVDHRSYVWGDTTSTTSGASFPNEVNIQGRLQGPFGYVLRTKAGGGALGPGIIDITVDSALAPGAAIVDPAAGTYTNYRIQIRDAAKGYQPSGLYTAKQTLELGNTPAALYPVPTVLSSARASNAKLIPASTATEIMRVAMPTGGRASINWQAVRGWPSSGTTSSSQVKTGVIAVTRLDNPALGNSGFGINAAAGGSASAGTAYNLTVTAVPDGDAVSIRVAQDSAAAQWVAFTADVLFLTSTGPAPAKVTAA